MSTPEINGCSCPVDKTIGLIGKRWTVLIVRDLMSGTKRFCQLEHSLPGISPKMLSRRLTELEESGVVKRSVFAEVPVRVEYELTDKGRDLKRIIDDMANWGQRWL